MVHGTKHVINHVEVDASLKVAQCGCPGKAAQLGVWQGKACGKGKRASSIARRGPFRANHEIFGLCLKATWYKLDRYHPGVGGTLGWNAGERRVRMDFLTRSSPIAQDFPASREARGTLSGRDLTGLFTCQ